MYKKTGDAFKDTIAYLFTALVSAGYHLLSFHDLIHTDEDITSGTVTGSLQIGPFPYQQKFDLCKLLSQVNTTCPLKKGPLNMALTVNIPALTPPVST